MTTPTRKAVRWLTAKIAYSAGFGITFLLIVGAALFQYHRLHPAVTTIRIAYGSGAQVRRQFLEELVTHGKDRHLDIKLVQSASTQETIRLVERRDADMGLITGAIHDDQAGRLLEILPLYMESLQLLVKEPIYDAVAKDFGALRGKTIGLDSRYSATDLIGSELLRFIGLVDRDDVPEYTPVYTPQRELLAKATAELPDAVFMIGGLPAPAIRQLIEAHAYRLVPLPFGASFNLEKFQAADDNVKPGAASLQLDRAFVEEFVIPAFTYSVLPPVPPADTRTIASRLLLVGNQDINDDAIHAMLELILSPEIRDLVRPPLSADLLDSNFQFPRHPGTESYARSLKPVDVESAFTAYGHVVEIWGLIITIYVAAANGIKYWKKRNIAERPSVGDYLMDVLAIEQEIVSISTVDDRLRLDQRLSDLKKAAIEHHVNETLEEAENFPSLLVTLADTRTRIWGRGV